MSHVIKEYDFGSYRHILYLSIALFVSFFLWAAFTEIDQHVRGFGKVIPSGKIREIQHLEGGIIQRISVKEGQVVKAGDVLFQIANKKAEADMREIQVGLLALKIKQFRLKAELDGKNSLGFPDAMREKNDGIIRSETGLFNARRAELNEKLNGLQKRMSQKVLKLDELDSTIQNLKRELEIAKEQLDIKRKLLNTGAVSRSQYLEASSTVKNFETRIAKVRKEVPITKSELSEIVNLLEETKQSWRSEAVEELNNVNVDIKKLTERIESYSDAVERTEIISSINGVVNKIHVNTIGGVIQPGQVIAEIIPVEEKLIVEAKISTQDRGKIWVGLPVVAKVSAYDYAIYGGIDGKLTYISADSFIDSQNQQFYTIRIELDKTNISKDKPVFPGMTVDVNILASKISVLAAILRPIQYIRENALREV